MAIPKRILDAEQRDRLLVRRLAAAGIEEESDAGVQILVAPTATAQTNLLTTFTSSAKGLVPASGGGTTAFLRADGTFAVPPGSGGGGSGNSYFPGGW